MAMKERESSPESGNAEDDAAASGAGPDGTIPVSGDGISLTSSEDGTNFNQEEDPDIGEVPAPDVPAEDRPDAE
jgi:hypothetical protein